jgi:DnaJ domain
MLKKGSSDSRKKCFFLFEFNGEPIMNMSFNDAASVLGLDGHITPEMVKQAYRKACSLYHPDRNPAGLEMMKAVNAAYETLKDFTGVVEGEEGYDEALNEAINAIINLTGIEIEICGAWVWVSGNTKPHKEVLGKNGAGFYWASKKMMWYFRPEDWKGGRGNKTIEEIRAKHGSIKVKTKESFKLHG